MSEKLQNIKDLLKDGKERCLVLGTKEPSDFYEDPCGLLDALSKITEAQGFSEVLSLGSKVRKVAERYQPFLKGSTYMPMAEFIIHALERKGYEGQCLFFVGFYKQQLQRLINSLRASGGNFTLVSLEPYSTKGVDYSLTDKFLPYQQWKEEMEKLL